MDIVFLRDKELTLRPLSEDDLPLFQKWVNDSEIRNLLSTYLPITFLQEKNWYESASKSRNEIVLTICINGEPVGNMGLHKINWKDRYATTGALIGERENWGKGYGTRAKKLLLKYAFDELGLRKIYSEALEFNQRSLNYSLKLGYQEEGRLRKHWLINGKYWDLVILALFAEDWRGRQAPSDLDRTMV